MGEGGEGGGRRGPGWGGQRKGTGRKTEGQAAHRDTRMQTGEASGPWDQKFPAGADGRGGWALLTWGIRCPAQNQTMSKCGVALEKL